VDAVSISNALANVTFLKFVLFTESISSPTLIPRSSFLLCSSSDTDDTNTPYPLSTPPIILKGRGSDRETRESVTVRGRDFVEHAIWRRRSWPEEGEDEEDFFDNVDVEFVVLEEDEDSICWNLQQ